MAEAARDTRNTGWRPRIIKISSKRQLTIPADIYRECRYSDYAFVTMSDDGSMNIAPIDVNSESDTVTILRALLDQGLDGEELVSEYERIAQSTVDYKAAIERSLDDVEHGRTSAFEDFRENVKRSYGV